MYDFKNQPAGMLDQVCTVDTTMKNPNPILGCQFYQAAVAFMAVSWYIPIPRFLWRWLCIAHSKVPVDNFDDLDHFPNPQTSS